MDFLWDYEIFVCCIVYFVEVGGIGFEDGVLLISLDFWSYSVIV